MSRIEITTEQQLRDLVGTPHSLVESKIYSQLFPDARRFIEAAPLVFIATTSADGHATVSPKGDAPGFVQIVDDHHLLIPERPGNKLLHGMGNILSTGEIGLIFVIPGTDEALRVDGTCRLFHGEELCEQLAARGKPAVLAMEVKIRQCFSHCGKAFKRSAAWQPEKWPERPDFSIGRQIATNAANNRVSRKAVETVVNAVVKSDYKNNL